MNKKPIWFWFDDGYKSVFTIAFPIMKEMELIGIVPIITSRVGRNFGGHKLMSLKQLTILKNNGWEMASHTNRHFALNKVSDTIVRYELSSSKRWIQKYLEITPERIVLSGGYPLGTYLRLKKMALKYYSYVRPRRQNLSKNHVIFHHIRGKKWFLKRLHYVMKKRKI